MVGDDDVRERTVDKEHEVRRPECSKDGKGAFKVEKSGGFLNKTGTHTHGNTRLAEERAEGDVVSKHRIA